MRQAETIYSAVGILVKTVGGRIGTELHHSEWHSRTRESVAIALGADERINVRGEVNFMTFVSARQD